MYAIFDFLPKHCPKCGADFNWDRRHPVVDPTQDYYALASHVCPHNCGLHYQFVETETLLDAARDVGGDLGN